MAAISKPSIVFFLPAMNDGGAERALVNLANELHQRGTFDVRFVLLRKEGVYLEIINPAISVEGMSEKGDVLFAFPALVKQLKSLKPDLLVSSLPITDLMAIWACKWLGKQTPRHVICIQNMRKDEFSTYTTLRSKIRAIAMRFFYKQADRFCAVSSAAKEELIEFFGVAEEKIRVIPNSLDFSQVQAQIKEKAGHPWLKNGRDFKTLIAVGRLVEQKDYPSLIKAFDIVRQKLDARLIILGDGEKKKQIEEQIKSLNLQDHVDLAGFQKNPFSYVSASDVFVLSSAWEGFGNVIIEALSCGTPVVATNCPGAPSEILNNGEYGQMATVKDPQGLAEAIIKSLNGDHPDKKVLKTRAQDYSIEAVTDQYQDYFERIMQ